jgi:hypothetical protein
MNATLADLLSDFADWASPEPSGFESPELAQMHERQLERERVMLEREHLNRWKDRPCQRSPSQECEPCTGECFI